VRACLQTACKIPLQQSSEFLRKPHRTQPNHCRVLTTRDVQNRFFFIQFGFGSLFEKLGYSSEWVWFGSVWFKKHGLVRILWLFATCVMAELLIYSNYYSDSRWHDFDIMHNNRRSSFLACNSWLRSAIRRHHPPQRAVLSQICCFGERKVALFQILLDGAEPRDVGTTWLSSPVCRRGG